jgi:phosphoribosylamine--glycine ligase
MRILVVGGGGREHALVWKLAQSPRTRALFCAPGNPGIAALAECVPIAADDVEGLVAWAKAQAIDLVVVGPELPLTLGLVDRLGAVGIRGFGPNAAAAALEGSKAFMKDLVAAEGIPTAAFATFTDAEQARRWVRERGAPIVVKADGLASGKGVFVCATLAEAEAAIDETMCRRAFGEAGARVVIEECLEGEELSCMALTDGTTVLPLATAQDHKRVGDGDRGPNTGGMGAYSPAPVATPALLAHVMRDIMEPTVRGLARRGIRFTGVLYAGLMVRDGRAKVLEFNVRFGDPECQVVLARLRSDLVDLLAAACGGQLAGADILWDPRPAVCVVLAAEGYPGVVRKGAEITGLEAASAQADTLVFHAATRRDGARVCTDGGRVLGVTALGDTIRAAIDHAYAAVARIEWVGMHYRRDIGYRALARTEESHGST